MPDPTRLATVYCTDEDIALRAPQDFHALAPVRLARGTDGAFAAGAGGTWVLTSASVDFAAYGIAAGSVVSLTRPGTFPPQGELFAVDSAAAGSVTLRRLGQKSGVGQPPAPAAGLSGVTFDVRTMGAAIDSASYDANKFFGVDDAIPDRATVRLYDRRELLTYTVLTVLRRAYIAADKVKADDYGLKLGLVTAELDDLRSRLTLHWGALAQGDPPSSVFGARVRR